MLTPPSKQHEWLRQLVGEWTFESECIMGPDQTAKSRGTESVRMLGDLWVIAEARGEMPAGTCPDGTQSPGGAMTFITTIGYDPARKKYVGTWVGSPMTHLFVYEADLDPTGKVLPLTTTGPSFADPTKLATYQDIIQIHSPDYRTLTSQTRNDDGTWTKFMTAHYRRAR